MPSYTTEGRPRAVVAIRLEPGVRNSTFFEQLPNPLLTYNGTTSYENFNMDIFPALEEVQELSEFWTYRGSLTSPPCEEGIRFFVARQILFVGVEQMQAILQVSTFSARQEQRVSLRTGILGDAANKHRSGHMRLMLKEPMKAYNVYDRASTRKQVFESCITYPSNRYPPHNR